MALGLALYLFVGSAAVATWSLVAAVAVAFALGVHFTGLPKAADPRYAGPAGAAPPECWQAPDARPAWHTPLTGVLSPGR